MNFVEELQWRGMLHDKTPGLEEQLAKEMTSGYIGFDPSANSLHIGNLVPIMMLKHLQLHGHKPIALVGGATGMIGDPSGKSEERNLLSEDVLRYNQECIKGQLEQFLDFNSGDTSARIVNNYDWFKEFDFLGFLREVGKHITVSYMMAKDSVQKRLETGISFTEFSYQLIQGYDFYWLYKYMNVRLQMGASDQWGNIVTGTELIRRKDGGDAFAFTCPLITKADGTKFGKTESGTVWLDRKRTSPYAFYQFWLNVSDTDAERYIKIFTLLSHEEIDTLINEHRQAPHLYGLQKELAKQVTTMVHSDEDYRDAVSITEKLFGKSSLIDLQELKESSWKDIAASLPFFQVSLSRLKNGINIVELTGEATGIFPSKGEARKMIQGGGLSLNKEKIATPETMITADHLLKEKYLLVQKGKKNYYVIETV